MTITQEEFDSLKQGDMLKMSNDLYEVQGKIGKIVFINKEDNSLSFNLKELQERDVELVKQPKTNQGFEIRKYPERPIVKIMHKDGGVSIRYLCEVTEDSFVCVTDGDSRESNKTVKWESDQNTFELVKQ